MKRDFASMPFDPALEKGAYNAIHVCLRLQPEERITLIIGEENLEITAAFVAQIREIGANYRVFVLEDYQKRPCLSLPKEILEDMKNSQVSLFAADPKPGELKMRMEITGFVNHVHKLRHGHAVSLTKEIMLQGMTADYLAVDDLSSRVIEKARQTEKIHAKTQAGTDIEATFIPELNWVKTSGIITTKKWGNLPGGEIFTSSHRVDGQFVVDGVVGDYLCAKYGDLQTFPLFIDIEDSRIRNLQCENKELLTDFKRYTSVDENSDRVGEFAIGTNLAVTDIIGNILQDEKIPGIHIAFGDPYPHHTGQTWHSSTHIDCVGRDFDIWLDGEKIMNEGEFLL